MRIEQGVKVFDAKEGYDQDIIYAKTYQGERVVHILDNGKAAIKVSYDSNLSPFAFYGLSQETAIKIAKLLNDDLRGGRLLLDIDLLNGSHKVEWVHSIKGCGSNIIHNRYMHTIEHGRYFIKWCEDEFLNDALKEVSDQ